MTVVSTPLPRTSQAAIHHNPTGRSIRRRVRRQWVLLLVMWPALILTPLVRSAFGDKQFIPILGIVTCTLVPVLLPLNIWTLVNVLRMRRVLRVNPWRLVECEIVPVSPQGQRAVGLANQMPDREIKVLAVLRINGVVMTAGPYRRYVDARITQLWCAGHPHQDAVASLPGGARPFRLVRYGGLVRASGASTG